jgi:protein involved in polysaccharide export with SLBB domain
MSVKYYFLLFLISTSVLVSQFSDEKKSSLLDKKELTIPQQSQVGLPLEDVVDTKTYMVGPSDVISVNVWISPPLSFNLTVTPEGTLIIPTVGEVKVSDVTLEEAKKNVTTEIRKKYIQGEITVTLVTPRPIVVTISGWVMNPGTYKAYAIDRVDKVIQEANRIEDIKQEDELRRLKDEQSTRNIFLKRKDGTKTRVDLPKFYAIKNNLSNPYLREGDVIVVPRKDRTKNVVAIYGEVNTPGRYEYVEGDSIHDLIEIAHGFTPRALTESIEFSRLDFQGKTLDTRVFTSEEIMIRKKDFLLQPGDRVVVKSKVELREDYYVTITGEVRYPGTYPITKDRTKLRDMIKIAGGFTEFASLKTAELIRRSIQPDEIELDRLLSQRGSVSVEDSAYYVVETNLRIRKEGVSVDFEKLFLQNDETQDVYLRMYDQVNIPSIQNTIYVFGQVETPGSIPFVKEKDVNYYIQKSGGFTENAREGDVRVIKAKTKQWLAPTETSVEEGDYIWIPKVPERTFAYYTTVISQVANILSVVLALVVVLKK